MFAHFELKIGMLFFLQIKPYKTVFKILFNMPNVAFLPFFHTSYAEKTKLLKQKNKLFLYIFENGCIIIFK